MFRALLLVGLACLSAHAADLNLADLSGKPVHLKDLRGKIAVINFWATWCGPCKAEMPLLVEASRKWAGKGNRDGDDSDDKSVFHGVLLLGLKQ